MLRTGLRILILTCALLVVLPASAQNNALINGGLEEGSFGPYTVRRGGEFPIYLPSGWDYWFAPSNGDRYNRSDRASIQPHPGPGPNPVEGGRALNVDCGFFTCTAAIYQQVGGVTPGAPVTASAYSQVKACDLGGGTSCGSAIESGSQTRIGIDPAGGTDPNNPAIVWSSWTQPHDQWLQQSVQTTATGATVTVFLYSTQSSFADLNKTYWDAVTLSGEGAGSAAPGEIAATAAPTAPPSVPFVVPQAEQSDGSIIHTVQAGDTVDSIAFAYGVSRQQILDLNNISDPRIISLGQKLIITTPAASASGGSSSTESASGEATAEAGVVEPSTAGEGDVTPTLAPVGEVGTGDASAESVTEAPPEPQPTVVVVTAPVVVAQAEALDPASAMAQVCVLFFNDANQNRLQEPGEDLLAGGTITLAMNGETVDLVQTDGVSEPHCFEGLTPGDYILLASAPDGYGLTTPDQLRLLANPGPAININFGAAEGVQPIVPPADTGVAVDEVVNEETAPQTLADQIMANSGLILFGLAGIVLIGGLGLTLLLRRR